MNIKAFSAVALFSTFALGFGVTVSGCASSNEEEAVDAEDSSEDQDLRALVIGESDKGKTFTVVAGQNVRVRLPSNPTTGYKWTVTQTDRTFGYPSSDTYKANSANGPVGSGGNQTLTWKTTTAISMEGKHTVELSYKRSTGAAAKKFTFTVDIVRPGATANCTTVRCGAGLKCEMKGTPKKATCVADQTQACFRGGCSGQLCSDQEGAISTCEFRPEYACYQAAECERQADGKCGFTKTAELTSCLANPGGQ
jgi:predicted secreted protein